MKKSSRTVGSKALHAKRQRLLATLALPSDGLPGSLALSYRRCGSPTCHCHADAHGHPSWTLTFMAEGAKRVIHVPSATVDVVRRRVDDGQAFKRGVAELFAINAQVVVLERRARREATAAKKRAPR